MPPFKILFSIDRGLTRNNVMEADLLRLRTAEIALFFLVKNSESECHQHIKKTFDEARTWSEPIPMAKFYQGYFTTNNDRAIQLSNTPNIWAMRKLTSFCFYSDDDGRTWFKSDVEVSLQKATAGRTRHNRARLKYETHIRALDVQYNCKRAHISRKMVPDMAERNNSTRLDHQQFRGFETRIQDYTDMRMFQLVSFALTSSFNPSLRFTLGLKSMSFSAFEMSA